MTIVFLFSLLLANSSWADDMIIKWEGSGFSYHISSDVLSLDGVSGNENQLIRVGPRNSITMIPYADENLPNIINLNLPKESFSYILVAGSQIRYFDKYGVVIDFNEMLATDGGTGIFVPEFYSSEKDGFSLLRFKNKNDMVKSILIYRGRLFSFASGVSISKLSNVTISNTLVTEEGRTIADLQSADQYSSVTAYIHGKPISLVDLRKKIDDVVTISKQFADIVNASEKSIKNGNTNNSNEEVTPEKNKDELKLSEAEKESIEIAKKLGIKHPKDLGIKVSNGKDSMTDAWELIKPFITDLRVKYKDRTYDPADMDKESIDIIDRIIETFHASEVGSVAHVGPAGSGKSETIASFVGRLNSNIGVGDLNKYMVFELNMAGLLAAGGKYSGGTESVMGALEAVLEALPSILVVDEVHNMKGSGSTEGKPSDIRQYIKTGMARGLIKLWGISTKPEFYNAFEDDPAWIQRHRIIEHAEPHGEALLKKLRGWVKYKFNGQIVLEDEILEKAVEFSNRFDAIGAQPRRAVKFIDYLIAMKRKENNGAIINPNYDDLIRFVKREFKIDPSVFEPEYMQPQLEKLSNSLAEKIEGQVWAKDALIRTEAIGLAGFQDLNRPQGRLLLAGPHGSGHTKLVQIYGEITQRPIVVIDLKNYSHSNDIEDFNKKIGESLQNNARSLFFFKNPESGSKEVQKNLGLILLNGDVLVRVKNNINIASMRNAVVIVSSFLHLEELNKLHDETFDFDPMVLKDNLGLNDDLLDQLEIVPIAPLKNEEFKRVIEKQLKDTLNNFGKFAKGLTVSVKNQDELVQWMTEKFSKGFASGTLSKAYLNGFNSILSEVAIARALNPKGSTIELEFINGQLKAHTGNNKCSLSLRRLSSNKP